MSERYTRLFALEENLYSDGSPVVISAGALLKDNQTGAVLAQLKIRNIGGKTIKAAAVRITCFDTVGKPLEGTAEKEYLDLTAGRDEEFGQKSLVSLPDTSARSFSVAVTWVAFSDNTVWNASGEALSTLPKPDSLSKALGDEELVKQYRLKYGAGTKSFPRKYKDLWFCPCGAFNHADEEVCHVCGQKLAALLPFDAEALKAERDKRLQKEADERRRAEEQANAAAAEKAKKSKKTAMIVTPIICVCIAFVILLTQVIIPKQKLNKAVSLIDAGEYEAAYMMLENLGNTEAVAESKYSRAMEKIDTGDFETAYMLLDGLDYQDSAQKQEQIKSQYHRAVLMKADVGGTVFFGTYEQDNNASNGKEDIEWLVLEKKDNRLLVISQYGLDSQTYNMGKEGAIWEACTLRQWLNNNFFKAAFSDEEKAMIPEATVPVDKNPNYDTDSDTDTQDRVFILSISEASVYFASKNERECKPTAYALSKNVRVYDSGNCAWWLRTPGDPDSAAMIHGDGSICCLGGGNVIVGTSVNSNLAVRPAMWIDLSN